MRRDSELCGVSFFESAQASQVSVVAIIRSLLMSDVRRVGVGSNFRNGIVRTSCIREEMGFVSMHTYKCLL